ncbi:hypothetical protein D3C73_933820 [compost metagenome]
MAAATEAVVPAGPGRLARGQQPCVGVQHHFVVGVGQGTEDRLFGRAGVGQQVQRFDAVAGKHHFVEVLTAGGAVDNHALGAALDPCHRASKAYPMFERCSQRFDIGT